MIIGIPKEIKTEENRVGMIPNGVKTLIKAGHEVLVQKGAGRGSGFLDKEYKKVGANMVSREEAWGANLVVKIKEPLKPEYKFFKKELSLFTYLHLANPELFQLTKKLMDSRVSAIAYETVQLEDGELPLLRPMSEVAGEMASQIGAYFLQKPRGGNGKLLAEVTGVKPPKVVVVGAGNVGQNAVRMASSMGAKVRVLDIKPKKLERLDKLYGGKVETLISNPENVRKSIKGADIVIGAVLVPGAKAPKVVTSEMVKQMEPGSVIVDVAIDQGGCIETSHPTSHKDPVFKKYGVTHYCVTNMPGAVPRTSTIALTNATLPYVLEIANLGFIRTIKKNSALARGVNVYQGHITVKAVAQAHSLEYKPLGELI